MERVDKSVERSGVGVGELCGLSTALLVSLGVLSDAGTDALGVPRSRGVTGVAGVMPLIAAVR